MGVAHWQLCFCSRVTTYLFWPLYLLWLLVGFRVEVEEAQHGLRRGTPRLALAARRVPAVLGPEDRRRGSRLRQAVESGWGGALLGCDAGGSVVCVGTAQALGRD